MQKYSKFFKSIIKKLKSKKVNLKKIFCLVLALLITTLSYIGLSTKNSKKTQNDNDTIIYIKRNNDNEYLRKNKDIKEYNYNDNRVVTKNINYDVEIALLLEKNNMTYEDLLKIINNPRYKNAFKNIFNKYPNLTLNDFLNIIRGKELRETLYLGDSRTKGMLLSRAIEEDKTVYGVGYGYKWLIGEGKFNCNNTNAINGAINGLESKMQTDKSYNIVIWLGVNDYKGVSSETYFQEFSDLANRRWKNHQIYIVSIGPVDDKRAKRVNNASINDFNKALKEKIENSNIENLSYIDLGLTSELISKFDGAGLHYGVSDCQNIYEIITRAIVEEERKLRTEILGFCYNILVDYDKILSNQDEMQNRINRQRIK
jgi:hypothetical protein